MTLAWSVPRQREVTDLSVVSGYLPATVDKTVWPTLPVLHHSVWNTVGPSKTSNCQQAAGFTFPEALFRLCCAASFLALSVRTGLTGGWRLPWTLWEPAWGCCLDPPRWKCPPGQSHSAPEGKRCPREAGSAGTGVLCRRGSRGPEGAESLAMAGSGETWGQQQLGSFSMAVVFLIRKFSFSPCFLVRRFVLPSFLFQISRGKVLKVLKFALVFISWKHNFWLRNISRGKKN